PMSHDLDHFTRHSCPYGRRLVCSPLELRIELTCGRQNRELDGVRAERGLKPKVGVEATHHLARLRAVKVDTGWSLEPGEQAGIACRVVVQLLANLIEVVSLDNRKTVPRIGKNVRRQALSARSPTRAGSRCLGRRCKWTDADQKHRCNDHPIPIQSNRHV